MLELVRGSRAIPLRASLAAPWITPIFLVPALAHAHALRRWVMKGERSGRLNGTDAGPTASRRDFTITDQPNQGPGA